MKGYLWSGCSLLLVSAAQLLMKWGMTHLPLFSLADLNLAFVVNNITAILVVGAGIVGYGISMLCWFFALRILPLNRAYALLSLSYALVYLGAVCLPWFNEPTYWLKTLGAISIMLGVWLIHSKPAATPAN